MTSRPVARPTAILSICSDFADSSERFVPLETPIKISEICLASSRLPSPSGSIGRVGSFKNSYLMYNGVVDDCVRSPQSATVFGEECATVLHPTSIMLRSREVSKHPSFIFSIPNHPPPNPSKRDCPACPPKPCPLIVHSCWGLQP